MDNTRYSRAKVISYGETEHLATFSISKRNNKRKRKILITVIVMILILTYFKLKLSNVDEDVGKKRIIRHKNLCRHVTPEPEIFLQETFDSNDNFFPYSYKERVCVTPNSSEVSKDRSRLEDFQKCFEDEKEGVYHCTTRYKAFEFLRIPENLTRKYWKTEIIHVPVACECTKTEITRTYGL